MFDPIAAVRGPAPEGGAAVRVNPTALATAHLTANLTARDAVAFHRPAWTTDRLPVRELGPVRTAPPIAVHRYILQPDPSLKVAYVQPSELGLVGFSLTVRRAVRADGGIEITGGTAHFNLSIYAALDLDTTMRVRGEWAAAVERAHPGVGGWTFRPVQRPGLPVALELPPGVAASDPVVLTSPAAGAVTASVELTQQAALTWQAALEQGAGSTLPGVFRVDSSGVAVVGTQLAREARALDTPVGRLLAGRGPADVRTVDPQQAVVGRLTVVTNDLIERITLALRPSHGHPPANQSFGPEGGSVEVTVVTTEPAAVGVDWTAQVAFRSIGWPAVPAAGRLTAANGWTDMVKPDSWLATYFVVAVPVDDRGQPQPVTAGSGEGVDGVVNFTAPYVANGLITSAFRAEYLQPLTVALPRYPGQPFGDVVLTAFAARGGTGGTGVRKLRADEASIVLLVGPTGRVDIRTNTDPLSEASTAADVLRLLHEFTG